MRSILVGITIILAATLQCVAAGSDVTSAEQRVNAFIADYLRVHTKVTAEKGEFEVWEAAVKELDAAHFSNGAGMALANVMYGTSPHDPKNEKWVRTAKRGTATIVETKANSDISPTWFEYELHPQGNDWRIARIREYLDSEEQLFSGAKDRARFAEAKKIALRPIPPVESFSADALIRAGSKVRWKDKNDESVIEWREVGKLSVDTGVVVVADFGYDASLFAPLALRVPPGRYGVRVATAFHRNAALQVRFSDAAVKSWHPADTTTGGHVTGVDAGNIAVFDVAAILNVTARNKERAFEAYAARGQLPQSLLLKVTGENDVAIVDSGFGDGAYPVYWGLDANGKPVMLIVDFFLSALVPL